MISRKVQHIVDANKMVEQDGHAARIIASRPQFGPLPPEFMNVAVYNDAGIRVNKRLWRDSEGYDRSTVALQMAEDRKLSRAVDSALVDRVEDAGFHFRPHSRQWERDSTQGTRPGENVVDGMQFGRELAGERAGRGR